MSFSYEIVLVKEYVHAKLTCYPTLLMEKIQLKLLNHTVREALHSLEGAYEIFSERRDVSTDF